MVTVNFKFVVLGLNTRYTHAQLRLEKLKEAGWLPEDSRIDTNGPIQSRLMFQLTKLLTVFQLLAGR